MKNKNMWPQRLNAGTGMTLGIFIGALVALVVQLITGDSSIWSWAIPVGLACGLAIGAGNKKSSTDQDER